MGILEQKEQKPKQDFMDIAQEDAMMKRQTMERIKEAQLKELPKEQEISKLQNALSGKDVESNKIEKELQEMEKYTPEDLKLAEELLFNGFAKKDIKLSDKTTATLYSTNTSEMSMINELIFDFTKKYETKEGRLDVSQKTIDMMNQLYVLAVSFKGYNDKEISESKGRSLDLIKSAFKKLSQLEIDGDLEAHKKLTDELKNAIKSRAAEIKRIPAAIIDAISYKRFEFERIMYDIVTRGDVLPKS